MTNRLVDGLRSILRKLKQPEPEPEPEFSRVVYRTTPRPGEACNGETVSGAALHKWVSSHLIMGDPLYVQAELVWGALDEGTYDVYLVAKKRDGEEEVTP